MQRVLIWDIWTRLFHWSLVLCVLFLLISGKTYTGFYDYHRYVGEAVAALLLFRVCWSFFGSTNNRLSTLVTHPKKSIDHFLALFRREVVPERGHNPAGGWAVLIMLFLLSFQAVSGLFIADEEELIEGAFYKTLPVVAHVFMIAIYRIRGKTNLVGRIINGRVEWPDQVPVPQVRFRHWSAGLAIACVVFAVVGLLTGWFSF